MLKKFKKKHRHLFKSKPQSQSKSLRDVTCVESFVFNTAKIISVSVESIKEESSQTNNYSNNSSLVSLLDNAFRSGKRNSLLNVHNLPSKRPYSTIEKSIGSDLDSIISENIEYLPKDNNVENIREKSKSLNVNSIPKITKTSTVEDVEIKSSKSLNNIPYEFQISKDDIFITEHGDISLVTQKPVNVEIINVTKRSFRLSGQNDCIIPKFAQTKIVEVETVEIIPTNEFLLTNPSNGYEEIENLFQSEINSSIYNQRIIISNNYTRGDLEIRNPLYNIFKVFIDIYNRCNYNFNESIIPIQYIEDDVIYTTEDRVSSINEDNSSHFKAIIIGGGIFLMIPVIKYLITKYFTELNSIESILPFTTTVISSTPIKSTEVEIPIPDAPTISLNTFMNNFHLRFHGSECIVNNNVRIYESFVKKFSENHMINPEIILDLDQNITRLK